MLSLSELGPLEREAVMDFMAGLPNLEELPTVLHATNHIAVDVPFPEQFFDVLVRLSEHQESLDAEEKAVQPGPPTTRSLRWLHKSIRRYFDYRWTQFHLELVTSTHHEPHPPTADDTSVHLMQFLLKEWGVPSLVKRHAAEVLQTLRAYRERDLTTQLFGVLLHTRAYDTHDVRALLSWSNLFDRFAIQQMVAGVGIAHVRLRDVPSLLRKALLDSGAFTDEPIVAVVKSTGTWERCRAALPRWCAADGRVPGIVADPLFYAPPFGAAHPYVGTRRGEAREEGRVSAFPPHRLVPLVQVLLLMLINYKLERAQSVMRGQAVARAHSPPRSALDAAARKSALRPASSHTSPSGSARTSKNASLHASIGGLSVARPITPDSDGRDSIDLEHACEPVDDPARARPHRTAKRSHAHSPDFDGTISGASRISFATPPRSIHSSFGTAQSTPPMHAQARGSKPPTPTPTDGQSLRDHQRSFEDQLRRLSLNMDGAMERFRARAM